MKPFRPNAGKSRGLNLANLLELKTKIRDSNNEQSRATLFDWSRNFYWTDSFGHSLHESVL